MDRCNQTMRLGERVIQLRTTVAERPYKMKMIKVMPMKTALNHNSEKVLSGGAHLLEERY